MESRNKEKKSRFRIEKLEERIAPIVHPFIPGGLPSQSQGGGGQAIAAGGIDPPGAANDMVNNPAGVGAPVPLNNPGNGSPSP